jgi:hypothetical protein
MGFSGWTVETRRYASLKNTKILGGLLSCYPTVTIGTLFVLLIIESEAKWALNPHEEIDCDRSETKRLKLPDFAPNCLGGLWGCTVGVEEALR